MIRRQLGIVGERDTLEINVLTRRKSVKEIYKIVSLMKYPV